MRLEVSILSLSIQNFDALLPRKRLNALVANLLRSPTKLLLHSLLYHRFVVPVHPEGSPTHESHGNDVEVTGDHNQLIHQYHESCSGNVLQ